MASHGGRWGPFGGFVTGTAILLEYAIAPAAIAIFIGGYVGSLIGVDGPLVYAAFYLCFVGIHLWGAGEALRIMLVITAIAVAALLVFIAGMIPHFEWAKSDRYRRQRDRARGQPLPARRLCRHLGGPAFRHVAVPRRRRRAAGRRGKR